MRSLLASLSCVALLLAGCGTDDGPGAAPDPSPGQGDPSPAQGSPPSPEALPTSHPPLVPYVSGAVLHRPDGSRQRLALDQSGEWGVTSVVPTAGGLLITDDRYFEGTVGMQRLDRHGVPVDAWSTTGPARLGPDGQVAWTRVPVPEAGQTWPAEIHVDDRRLEVPGHHRPHILQFDGALVVYTATVVRSGRGHQRTFRTSVPGAPTPVPEPLPGEVGPGREHWWRWQGRELEIGSGEAVVARFRDRGLGGVGAAPVWEDEDHLLATYVDRGRQALVRIGVDGTLARVTGWVPRTRAGHAVVPRVSR